MALSDAYATPAQYRAQVSGEFATSGDDTEIARELTAVSRLIDRITGRPLGFNNDGEEDVARVYKMRGGYVIDIDDHMSVTTVDVSPPIGTPTWSELAAGSWVLLPRNAALLPSPEPYHQIEFVAQYPVAGDLVKVTGIGGWAAVPEGVRTATIELTSILRLESPRATNRMNDVGQVLSTSRRAQNVIDDLINSFRTVRGVMA